MSSSPTGQACKQSQEALQLLLTEPYFGGLGRNSKHVGLTPNL